MRPQRLSSFDYRGCHRYFITCCCWQRRLLFTGDTVALIAPAALRTLSERSFRTLAWVCMPDHMHLLLEGETADAALRPAMTLMRQRTAIAYRRSWGRPLWQDGYYERVIRDEKSLVVNIAYMLNNPVRAGLVDEWHQYPHSGAVAISDFSRRG